MYSNRKRRCVASKQTLPLFKAALFFRKLTATADFKTSLPVICVAGIMVGIQSDVSVENQITSCEKCAHVTTAVIILQQWNAVSKVKRASRCQV